MSESKHKTVCRTCTDSIRVMKAGLLERLLLCAVEVRSWSLKLWGLTLPSCASTRPGLVRAHHKTPHSGNNARSGPKTHAVEAQWRSVFTTAAGCQRAQSQRMYTLHLGRSMGSAEHTRAGSSEPLEDRVWKVPGTSLNHQQFLLCTYTNTDTPIPLSLWGHNGLSSFFSQA